MLSQAVATRHRNKALYALELKDVSKCQSLKQIAFVVL